MINRISAFTHSCVRPHLPSVEIAGDDESDGDELQSNYKISSKTL